MKSFAAISAIVSDFIARLFSFHRSKDGIMFKTFGCFFAFGRWLGNCFSPAFVVEWHGVKESYVYDGKKHMPAWATITFRDNNFTETRISFYGWKGFGWNSEHIARKWGKASEQDWGTCHFYNGVLGHHMDV